MEYKRGHSDSLLLSEKCQVFICFFMFNEGKTVSRFLKDESDKQVCNVLFTFSLVLGCTFRGKIESSIAFLRLCFVIFKSFKNLNF